MNQFDPAGEVLWDIRAAVPVVSEIDQLNGVRLVITNRAESELVIMAVVTEMVGADQRRCKSFAETKGHPLHQFILSLPVGKGEGTFGAFARLDSDRGSRDVLAVHRHLEGA